MVALAQQLRRRRLALGLTVTETARRAGITRAYLHRLERDGGIAPSFQVLDRLARVLGANPLALSALSTSITPPTSPCFRLDSARSHRRTSSIPESWPCSARLHPTHAQTRGRSTGP